MTTKDRAFYVLILLVTVSAILGMGIISAFSHDWYPYECCSAQDCAPATITQVSMPQLAASLMPGNTLPSMMLVTTIHGSVLVPADFKPRASQDGRAHACMIRRHDAIDSMRLICLFLPPSS